MEPVAKRPKADATIPTIVVMGATGVGKGSTLNSCFSTKQFSTSGGVASDTIKPVSFVLPWKGTGAMMRGVDLCGFSDSEGRDTGFIEAMVSHLREEVRYVNCFLLLLNSQEARIGMHLKDMLVALRNVFGSPFMKNVVVGFTRWDYSKKGAILRRGVTKDALKASVNGILRTLLGHDHDCECVYLDNTVHMLTTEELQELYTCTRCKNSSEELPFITRSFDEALEAIRRTAVANDPFQCAAIEGTLAERDIGRDSIEREKAAIAQGEDAFARFSAEWADVGIDEPRKLDRQLQEAARTAREKLQSFLVSKCKPDLEHVMTSVLGRFDAKLRDTLHSLIFANKNAAAGFNRTLRMNLVRDYKAFIGDQSNDEAKTPRQRFDAIHSQHNEFVVQFIIRSRGGSLAWAPFIVLQEQLRMEQVDAREKLLRDDLKVGKPLPSISESLKGAALIQRLGEAAPAWLLASSEGQRTGT